MKRNLNCSGWTDVLVEESDHHDGQAGEEKVVAGNEAVAKQGLKDEAYESHKECERISLPVQSRR